jgi:hypothetical protein
MNLDAINERLRTATDVRVHAHRAREAGQIDVPTYVRRLAWARRVEDECEPIRRAAGYSCSRAYELCTAHTADYYRPRR